ncbi:MAG: Sua5/YciO/YrdC/YwlC family protein, partial [Syntrophomonas sp.]
IILPKRKRDNENEYVIPSEVTAGEHSVHIVCIDDITEYMAVLSDSPIAVTSANMSGSKLITNPLDVIYKFEKQVDKFLIGEKKQYKFSTTIVDFSKEIPRIARNTSYRIVKELQSIIPGLETCSRKNSHNNYN